MGWKFWKKEPEATLSATLVPSLGSILNTGISELNAERMQRSEIGRIVKETQLTLDDGLVALTKLVKENEVAALNRHRYLLRRLGAIENRVWRKKELDPIDKPSPSEEK